MNRLATAVVALAGLPLLLMGCAQDQEYSRLDAAYRTTLARNQELQSQLDSLEEEIRLLQQRLMESEGGLSGASGTNAELRAQLDRLREEYRALEERLNSIDITLNPEVDLALRELAAANPGLLSYDPARGMLRFSSDLTFALGSTEVQPAGRDALQRLAQTLTSSAAQGYDLRIVGHTDNVPISSGNRARHATNTHLSAHRAIAVRDVLASSGVSNERMQVAGWGEYRPAVQNRAGRQGTPENRRVEIFLVASSSAALPSGGASAPASSQPSSTLEPIK